MSGNKPLLPSLLSALFSALLFSAMPAPLKADVADPKGDVASPNNPPSSVRADVASPNDTPPSARGDVAERQGGVASPTLPPLSASPDPDRALVDIPLPAAAADAPAPTALVVEFGEPVPVDAVRGVTVHLRSGDGWLSASLPTDRARGKVRLPFGSFAPEGSAGPAAKADLVRISLWRLAPDSDTPSIAIPFVGLVPAADIAIVRATKATAPGETDFAAQMATRLERILSRAGLDFDTLDDTALAHLNRGSGATPPPVVLLPYAPRLTPAHIAALRAHVSAGGRIVAFYNGSPELSAILGLAQPRYEHSRTGWGTMDWGGRRIPHHTGNLHVPVVKKGAEATVLATWTDANGAKTGLPAVVATRHGALFAHIPPLAFPAAQDLLRSLLAAQPATAQPHEGSAAQIGSAAAGAENPATKAGSAAIPSLPIVGAWVTTPHLPARVPPALNTLYAYLAAVPRPGAATTSKSGGAAAAKSNGAATAKSGGSGGDAPRPFPAIHIWLPLLHPVDRPDAHWLDPANPDDRSAALRRVRAAALRHPAGIHFDYLRSGDGTPASPEATAAVTSLLREASALARDVSPSTVLSAAVFPTPAAAASRNQEWPAWLREELLDYVAPMLYADDPASFRAMLAQCLAAAPADRIVAGIGTGADEAQVDASAFAAELAIAAEAGLCGVAFFPLDDALLELLDGAK